MRWSLAKSAAVLIGALLAFGAEAHCGRDLQRAHRIAGSVYELVYATDPSPLPLGRHFSMEIFVCPNPGQAAAEGLSVQATMPTHGHGMNYEPRVNQLGSGHFRVEGMMFHMRGPWTISFQVGVPGRSEPIEHRIELK